MELINSHYSIGNWCYNSQQIVPVTFSGIPPMKMVLQPRGFSRVVGSGALGLGGKRMQLLNVKVCFATWPKEEQIGVKSGSKHPGQSMVLWGILIRPAEKFCKHNQVINYVKCYSVPDKKSVFKYGKRYLHNNRFNWIDIHCHKLPSYKSFIKMFILIT